MTGIRRCITSMARSPRRLLAIVGPNGAGKSTLFRGIVGILKPLAGAILTGDLDVRDIAYLPQSADIDRSFPISVFDFVGTGLWRSTGFFGGMGDSRSREKIAQALAAVGLSGFENRSIGTLSGGQMQRLLFARVLLQDARLIVLDEPSTPSTPKPRTICWRWCGAGTLRSARCWRRCTTWISCARTFPKPCCWRAGRWRGAKPPTC
jgi:energy-coupling factor transporter ATP-binding protein EcfA2